MRLRFSRPLPRLLDILVLLALSVYVLAGVPVVPFHGDESTQAFMTRDYTYQFIERDLSKVTHREPPLDPMEAYLRLINGTLNKYAMGLAWHLAGFSPDDVNTPWEWGGSFEYNISAGHMPAPDFLRTLRIPSAVLTVAAVWLVYALGVLVGGRGAGLLGAALLALNPAVLLNGRRAMMEGSMLASMIAVVIAGVLVVRAERPAPDRAVPRWQRWAAWALFGFTAAIALASKHTNAGTVGAVGLSALLISLPAGSIVQTGFWLGVGGRVLRGAGAAALAFGVFYLLTPAWWGDPFMRAVEIAKLRTDLLDAQVNIIGGYADRADATAGFLRQTFGLHGQYYEVAEWGGFVGGEIVAYEASGLAGVLIPGDAAAVAFAALTVVGGLRLVLRPGPGNGRSAALVFVWAGAMLASALLVTPLEWQRYYLPAIAAVCVLAGQAARRPVSLMPDRAGPPGQQDPQGFPDPQGRAGPPSAA